MDYAIDLGRFEQLGAGFQRAPEMTMRELEAAVTEADLLIEREVQDRMPTARGLLRASVFHEETVNDTGVTGLVATPLIYAEPVELGTKPHFPPVDALIDWVKLKLGISSDKAARGAAFAIAKKISLRGTPAQYPFRDTFLALEAQVHAIFDRAAARIAAQIPGAA